MGLCTDNAAHEGRMSIDPAPIRHSPVPPHMPVVFVFPAGSLGLRTPGGREVEPLVLNPWACIDPPVHIEDAGRITWPPNRPHERKGAGCHPRAAKVPASTAQPQWRSPLTSGEISWSF